MKNIGQLMKQAQQFQEKVDELQKKMEHVTVEGNAGGGLVKATVTGKGILKNITINPTLMLPDEREMLEDLIVAAVNDARHKADTQMSEEMTKLTGGMQLPSGFKMPF